MQLFNDPEKRRPVTIIAGFPITGFVLLGADAEEGGGYAKSSVRKIATIDEADYKCLIGGAGDGDFIDLSVQETIQTLKSTQIPITLEVLRLTIESVVTDIYINRIDTLSLPQQRASEFDLLCALWTRESQAVQLVKVSRALSLIRDRAEVIGKGSPLARYLIETLQLTEMHHRHVERMCAYLLAQVKAHVKDCGGASQIMSLSAEGIIKELPVYVIREDETLTDLVMSGGVKWLFHWADPIGWRFNMSKLDGVVDQVAAIIKRDIREHVSRLGVGVPQSQSSPPAPQSTTHDPKGQLPSPE